MTRSRSKNLGLATLILASVILLTLFYRSTYHVGKDSWVSNSTDFRAFYCAGKAVRNGYDPYRVEPIRTCERDALAISRLSFNEKHILIAPMPTTSLGPFIVLSELDIVDATSLWLAICSVAIIITSLVLSKLTNVRIVYCLLALSLSEAYASLEIGQLVPIAVLAITCAAYAINQSQYSTATIWLCVATIEPHLALPAILGCFVFIKESRRLLSTGIIALSLLNILLEPTTTIEYLTQIVPAHARSEIANFGGQYGLPALLVAYGVASKTALSLGSIDYVLMVLVGLVLARNFKQRNPAFVVTAPVAAGLLGGPFLHIHQMAAAIPFAVGLIDQFRGVKRARYITVAATLLLCIPWQAIEQTGAIADRYPSHATGPPPKLATARPDDSIEISYTDFIDAYANRVDNRTREQILLWKIPTWLSLVILLGVGTSLREYRHNRPSLTTKSQESLTAK